MVVHLKVYLTRFVALEAMLTSATSTVNVFPPEMCLDMQAVKQASADLADKPGQHRCDVM
jgi:hypothetical protein